jgi:hypothetical protein
LVDMSQGDPDIEAKVIAHVEHTEKMEHNHQHHDPLGVAV